MRFYRILIVTFSIAVLIQSKLCWADTNDEAVKKAVHQHVRGNTDVDDDGLAVMLVTIKVDGKKHFVSGEILHTWRHFDSTPIQYEVTINEDGTVSGTVVVKRVNNPDGDVIKNDRSGHLSGKVGALKCDILMDQRAMRGAVKLIGMVLQEALR